MDIFLDKLLYELFYSTSNVCIGSLVARHASVSGVDFLRRLVDFALFMIFIVLFVAALSHPTDGSVYMSPLSLRLLFLSFFFSFYLWGNLAANSDRRLKIADLNLHLWARSILFLGHPNPFRLRTVIYKAVLIITTIVMFAMLLTTFDSRATGIAAIIWLFGTLVLALILFGRTIGLWGRTRK